MEATIKVIITSNCEKIYYSKSNLSGLINLIYLFIYSYYLYIYLYYLNTQKKII